MDSAFWNNKKVLITGHTGFKGSWLSLWLQRKGADTIGYALPPPTSPSFFEIGEIASSMVSIEGDVRDLSHLITVIEKYKPEIVIHMAAQSLVRYSYQHPMETYSINVMGTANILEAIRRTRTVRTALIITSDKCYQNDGRVQGYREFDPLGGNDPYSSSKACAELVTAAYSKSFFATDETSESTISIASARAGNVIGGGDWSADRLIPDIIRAVISDMPLIIRNPKAVRPWQHVLEPLNGYLDLIEHLWVHGPRFKGGWNFGPVDADCKPVEWILNTLSRLWEGGIRWELDTADNPHEDSFLKVDSTQARKILGWSTKLIVGDALKWTVEWYQGYMNQQNMRQISDEQIQQYEELN